MSFAISEPRSAKPVAIAPRRNDPALFERNRFITGVTDGFVRFDYHGWHQELLQRRITPEDVAWACELVGGPLGPANGTMHFAPQATSRRSRSASSVNFENGLQREGD